MFTKAAVELIGTFIFLSVILSQGQAVPIGVALAAVIFFGGAVSGGHFNPAVSFMKFLDGGLDSTGVATYIVAQLIGAVLALYFYRQTLTM